MSGISKMFNNPQYFFCDKNNLFQVVLRPHIVILVHHDCIKGIIFGITKDVIFRSK